MREMLHGCAVSDEAFGSRAKVKTIPAWFTGLLQPGDLFLRPQNFY